MYYLRFCDRFKVTPLDGNVNPQEEEQPLLFRPPFPEEDGIKPGGYEPFKGYPLMGFNPKEDLTPGLIQATHECGLLINVPCHHGLLLPEVDNSSRVAFHWNGKSPHFFQMTFVKAHLGVLRPVVQCRYCREMWSVEWEDIFPHVKCEELKKDC